MADGTDVIGGRIAGAREARGMTQQELAGAAGLERSALAKIERGLRGIAAVELAALARALDYRIEWFLSQGPAAVTLHRTRTDTGLELATIDAELERIARDVEFVDSLDPALIGDRGAPLPAPGSATAAEAMAGQARHLCGADASEPLYDLVRIVAHVGLLTFSSPLGSETADAAMTLLARGGVSLVNSTSLVGRRRVAVAHELGHYLLADDYRVDWRVADSGGADRVESLLDRFARAFLAPGPAVTSFWQAHRDHDLRTAAVLATSHFRIDMSTLARRLAELELATAADCAAIRDVRTTTSDIIEHDLIVPFDLEGTTLPRLYEQAVLGLYREQRISAERAVALLRGTLEPEDLPELRRPHRDEIWSLIS